MQLILISDFSICDDPLVIEQMFKMGLERFHIREKDEDKVKGFVRNMDVCYQDQLSFHGDGDIFGIASHGEVKNSRSSSCHSMEEVRSSDKEYVFLSPIFNSISKAGYLSNFDINDLRQELPGVLTKVYALGGVSDENLQQVQESGFYGAVVKGFVWNCGVSPIEQLELLLNNCS